MILATTIIVIVCHLRSTAKSRRQHLEQARITMQGEKMHLHATDV